MPERRGDGAQGRGVPGEARQRRGGRGGVPVELHASHPVQDLRTMQGTTAQRRPAAGDDDERADKQTNKACSADISASAPCRADG